MWLWCKGRTSNIQHRTPNIQWRKRSAELVLRRRRSCFGPWLVATLDIMQMNLDEQKVVVFGGARGIGRAIAEGFAAERCRVWTFDRDPTAAQSDGTSVAGDVTSYAEVQAFAGSVGAVDHVIFSVGAGSGKFGFPFWNLEPGDWARVLELNLIGAVNVAHAFAPKLIERGQGSMLFLVSVAGQMGSQTDPPYSAAKAGLINFTQCAAKDLAPYGVRVNALSPGMVKTDLNESVWRAGQANLPQSQRQEYAVWAEEKIRKVSPLGRWQTPAEYAAMAVFLASEHGRNITGQTINIDGGQVMHS
jgi:NAD(P)-dependent dehydrogenase (short-subunit alcohol dehydrogenase family)